MKVRGFTVVELLIVVAIIGILLVVGVVNLRGSLVNARDTERQVDVETIATHLESFYKLGGTSSTTVGRYPSTAMFDDTEETLKSFLRDISLSSMTAPGADNVVSSFVDATNATQTTGGVSPQPTATTYVYQPLMISGSSYALCTSESDDCQKFNLYYLKESDSTVQVVTSKSQ